MFELNIREDLRLVDVYFFDGNPVAFVFDVLKDVEVPIVKVDMPSREEGYFVVGGNARFTIMDETMKAKKGERVVLNYFETILFLNNTKELLLTKYKGSFLGRKVVEKKDRNWGFCKLFKMCILINEVGFKSVKDVFPEKSIIKDGKLIEDCLKPDYSVYLDISKYLDEHGRKSVKS